MEGNYVVTQVKLDPALVPELERRCVSRKTLSGT